MTVITTTTTTTSSTDNCRCWMMIESRALGSSRCDERCGQMCCCCCDQSTARAIVVSGDCKQSKAEQTAIDVFFRVSKLPRAIFLFSSVKILIIAGWFGYKTAFNLCHLITTAKAHMNTSVQFSSSDHLFFSLVNITPKSQDELFRELH